MGTYIIPRNTKGENRILMIFSTKALIYTAIGVGIGFMTKMFFDALSLGFIGIILIVVLGLVGFGIGTLKVPKIEKFQFTKQTAGEKIDDIIVRAFKFYRNKDRKYIYKGDTKDGKQSIN